MKMTEQTTLAELQAYLRACGDPFVTLMKGLEGKRHAIVNVPDVGSFIGNGKTVAEALEAAFCEFRRATLPEGLKQFLSEHDQYDRATGDLRRPIERLCYGCQHARADHPNASGCQLWHSES